MTKFSLFLFLAFLIATPIHSHAQKKDKKSSKSGKNGEAPSLEIKDACKRAESVVKIKADMTPFRFDKITTTKIQYKPYDKVWTVVIPLYHSTNYKFIVNSEGMPTNVEIKITDKPLKMSTAKVLHESSDKHFTYEVPEGFEGTRIYVSIRVPADQEYNNRVRNKGCIIMGSGYHNLEF
ncbi:MAG: hypothetical protein CL840_17820 [Crocinitomicaceae bacterium]|nr:hypothetical protein [Crocinitomicaceae bacterium]|tara:strand:+ start:1046 stop:1582 length:537 start_codon:yes stop_codon:yes gene_type:complete